MVAPIGANKLREAIPIWIEDAENRLSSMFRVLLCDLFSDLIELDDRVSKLDEMSKLNVQQDPVAMKMR